jgi:hypothetical protein
MTTLDQIRSKALDEIDRARRNFKLAFFAAVAFESLFLLGMLLVADLRDKLHLLIFFATGLIYMPLVMGLVALGAWVDRSVLRVLARIDEFADKSPKP